jgi:hypothetical protein
MSIQIRICKLYLETLETHTNLRELVVKFMTAKVTDPLAPYGGSDTHFTPDGPIGKTGLKVKHAHITQDVSIIYRLHSSNPRLLDMYGLFSHKESGTGNAANIKTQKQLAGRLSNQDFTPLGQVEPAQPQQQQNTKKGNKFRE